jgi:hypothetical protein
MANIGIMSIGKVDAINKESIQTNFFVLVMPLFPIESFYCLGNTPQGNLGFRIPLHLKSIVLDYLRWWASIVSLTLIFLAFAAEQYLLLIAGIIGMILFLSTFWVGRLSKKEIIRRQILVNIVGIGADPSILPKEMIQETMAKLEEAWRQANIGTLRENWRNVSSLSSMEKNLYPLLYCLAMYAGEKQLAERSWHNIESMVGVRSIY